MNFGGIFSRERKNSTTNTNKSNAEIQKNSNDLRSRSSNPPKENNTTSLFLDTEIELIKINKKLNQILQNIELQNKNLFENVNFFYFLCFAYFHGFSFLSITVDADYLDSFK